MKGSDPSFFNSKTVYNFTHLRYNKARCLTSGSYTSSGGEK